MKPPRGAVRIMSIVFADGRTVHTAGCDNCSWTYRNSVKSDVEQHKRWHQCPDGAS